MKILFISKGKSDYDKWMRISLKLKSTINHPFEPVIVTSFGPDQRKVNGIEVLNCYASFDEYLKVNYRSPDIENKLIALSNVVPASTYKADERYIFHSSKEKHLCIEQIFLTERAIEIYKDLLPNYIFLAGAGTLIRTVFMSVGKSFKIKSYRILGAHHMNIGRKGLRYFFCDNDQGDFSLLGDEPFKQDEQLLSKYVDEFINQLKSKTYRFDKYSRKTGRFWRVSKSDFSMVKDIFGWFKNKIKGNLLSAEKYKQKIFFLLRQKLLKTIYDDVQKINQKNIIFPLNVPSDAQLRLRAREWTDSISIIRQIASNLPYNFLLLIKAHPGNPGMLSRFEINSLRRQFSNIRFISHKESLFDLIKNCSAIVVVNGSAALESSILNRPCIYLGHSYLKHLPNCFFDIIPGKLENFLCEIINKKEIKYKSSDINDVLKRFYLHTYPPIQYTHNAKDIDDVIASGIVELVGKK